MSEPIGSFINDTDSGKPAANSTADAGSGNQDRTNGPETINGFESESPDTERIGGSFTGGEPRRTKSGKIDGRTQRYKRGTGKEETSDVHLSKLDIAEVLFSIHLMGAEILKTPELELDKDECSKLGDAIKEVGKYYNVLFDPKKVAIFHLAIVAGGIYGTRLFAIRNRVATQVKPAPSPINRPAATAPSNRPIPINGKAQEPGTIPVEAIWGNQGAGLE